MAFPEVSRRRAYDGLPKPISGLDTISWNYRQPRVYAPAAKAANSHAQQANMQMQLRPEMREQRTSPQSQIPIADARLHHGYWSQSSLAITTGAPYGNPPLNRSDPSIISSSNLDPETPSPLSRLQHAYVPNVPHDNGARYDTRADFRRPSITFASIFDSAMEEKGLIKSADSVAWREDWALRIATKERIAEIVKAHPLPTDTTLSPWTMLRYMFLSTYSRLFVLVILTNLIFMGHAIVLCIFKPGLFTYNTAANWVSGNLLAAVTMRHENFVNLIFTTCISFTWMPLSLRRLAAKVYSYGGIHSSCAISAAGWYVFFDITVIQQFSKLGTPIELWAMGCTLAAMSTIFLITLFISLPSIRERWHNWWELSHRYLGWTGVGIVWTQVIVLSVATARSANQPFLEVVSKSPPFWCLVIITCLIIYPWLWLRRIQITAEKLSTHATRLWFPPHRRTTVGMTTRLSHRPLLENHAFATIPSPDGKKGYSIVVSNAGDWTAQMISSPTSHIWVRGAPTMGVLRVAMLFNPVVIVATGSGIGPCLSFLQVCTVPLRVVWSARSPDETYGDSIMEAVFKADANAVVIDTKRTGRPDLVPIVHSVYKECSAEAVVIISNPKVTREVVYNLESRKVPTFGAIFDS